MLFCFSALSESEYLSSLFVHNPISAETALLKATFLGIAELCPYQIPTLKS